VTIRRRCQLNGWVRSGSGEELWLQMAVLAVTRSDAAFVGL